MRRIVTVACLSLALTSIGLFPSKALSGINRDTNMKGGATGYIKCSHIIGNKTKVEIRIIPATKDNLINAVNFDIGIEGSNTQKIFEPVIPSTFDYKTQLIFEGYRKEAFVEGSAYNIGLTGFYNYTFRKKLDVICD